MDQLNARRARSILTRLQPAAALGPAGVTPAAVVITVGPALSAVRASSRCTEAMRCAQSAILIAFLLLLDRNQKTTVRIVLMARNPSRVVTSSRIVWTFARLDRRDLQDLASSVLLESSNLNQDPEAA